MAPAEAHALVDSYRHAARTVASANTELTPLLHQAAALLDTAQRVPSLEDVAINLAYDADDLKWRVDFIEQTDGFSMSPYVLLTLEPVQDWRSKDADDLDFSQLAFLLVNADSQGELEALVTWLVETGAFEASEVTSEQPVIPFKYRELFGGTLAMAYNGGWRTEAELPSWLLAGMAKHGDLSDESLVELAIVAFDNHADARNLAKPNPFELDRELGVFGPFAAQLVERPEVGRLFIERLLDEHDETTDTRLNIHQDSSARATQLADIVIAAGSSGDVGERTTFVDRLVRTVNADGNTSEPVFWATWAVHAELVLEHEITTTEPTFDTHHVMPDFMREKWSPLWDEKLNPDGVEPIMGAADAAIDGFHTAVTVGKGPAWNFYDWISKEEGLAPPETGNDAGGTYSTREKRPFEGSRMHFDAASQGRNVITHALRDGSDTGDIYADEFAIISHGTGANGKPTFTINLPGVTDLSDPSPGWHPLHMTVRDIDQAAAYSAHSTKVEDNLYAQMVKRALQANDVPLGSNIMIVGHSFGADTAADLAADDGFNEDYNLTHIVAAAYDSVPQLAHIDPSIKVLVLQNENDIAVKAEMAGRHIASNTPSVSSNTFAHDLRVFDGGTTGVGHHQDNYNEYLDATNDAKITTFFESVTETGYADAGESFAIDVTLDESLL